MLDLRILVLEADESSLWTAQKEMENKDFEEVENWNLHFLVKLL